MGMGPSQTKLAVFAAISLTIAGCTRKDAEIQPSDTLPRVPVPEDARGRYEKAKNAQVAEPSQVVPEDPAKIQEMLAAATKEMAPVLAKGVPTMIQAAAEADRSKVPLSTLMRNPDAPIVGEYALQSIVIGEALEKSVERKDLTRAQGEEIASKLSATKDASTLLELSKKLLPKGAYERALGIE